MMKKYESYKKVDLPWVNEIPEHWKKERNKNIFFENKVIVGEEFKEYKLLSLTKKGVIYRDLDNGKGKFPASFSNYKKVKKGNMILCLFDIDETPRTVGLSSLDGMITGAYDVLGIKEHVLKEYIYYYYLNIDNFKGLRPFYKGLRKTIKMEDFKALDIYIPPKSEQEKIAAFLDYKIGKINAAIELEEKKKAAIEKLKQKIISKTVTKGLNSNVQMKDTGIDWIEQAPKHWKVKKLKYCFNLKKGLNITKDNLISKGAFVFNYGQVHSKQNKQVNCNKKLFKYVDLNYLRTNPGAIVSKGDFIFADTSEDIQGCGNFVYIDNICELLAGYHTIILKTNSLRDNRYFAYLFFSDLWRIQIRNRVTGVKVFSITQNLLKNLDVLIPSINEQKEIADYLDKKCSQIDAYISKVDEKIKKLEALKQSLISEVVTGQVDVRGFKIPEGV